MSGLRISEVGVGNVFEIIQAKLFKIFLILMSLVTLHVLKLRNDEKSE